MSDTMKLFGVKPNGETVLLGDAAITPAMKRADIAREQFGPLTPDESGNDADLCLWALENYHKWLVAQGWTLAPTAQGE